MTLNRRVHFLIDPEQYSALEEVVRVRWKATGKRITLGTLVREAEADYLAKHQAKPEPRPRLRRSK